MEKETEPSTLPAHRLAEVGAEIEVEAEGFKPLKFVKTTYGDALAKLSAWHKEEVSTETSLLFESLHHELQALFSKPPPYLHEEEAGEFRFAAMQGQQIGKRSRLRGYIAGESNIRGIFTRSKLTCPRCGESKRVEIKDDPDALYNAITRVPGAGKFVSDPADVCTDGKHHDWKVEKEDPALLYSQISVRDAIGVNADGPSVGRDYTGFLIGSIPDSKDVELTGYPFANRKTDQIEFLAMQAQAASTSIQNFALDDEQIAFLRENSAEHRTLLDFERWAIPCNPRISGRVYAKLAVMLAYASPVWLQVNGQRKSGVMRVFLFGDPRTGKGSTGNYLRQKLALGHHAIGENSSRSGFTYAIDTDSKLVRWGVLVEADRGLVVVEGLHKFPPDDLATLRESLVQLYVEVRRMFSARAEARTRIIADANPRQELGKYPFACQGARDVGCFLDSVDLTRWDVFIPFRSGDVDAPRMTEAALEGQDDETFLKVMALLIPWAWSRQPDEIQFTETALASARALFQEILENYAVPEIPVVHEDSFWSILRLAAAFAILSFSTVDGKIVIVDERHIKLAHDFLVKTLEELEIPEFRATMGEVKLTEAEITETQEYLANSDVATKLVDALVTGPKNSPELGVLLGHNEASIRRVAIDLKIRGLVSKSSRGYGLTKRGVLLWKAHPPAGCFEEERGEGSAPTQGQGRLLMESQGDNRERVAICPRCGTDLSKADNPSHYLCPSCGWEFPTLEFDGNGVRQSPAPADEGYLGTDVDASALENSRRTVKSEANGESVSLKDAEGKPIRKPMLAGALSRGINYKHQTWKAQQLEKFWFDNCERLSPEELRSGLKLLEEFIDSGQKAHRDSVRRFRKELSK